MAAVAYRVRMDVDETYAVIRDRVAAYRDSNVQQFGSVRNNISSVRRGIEQAWEDNSTYVTAGRLADYIEVPSTEIGRCMTGLSEILDVNGMHGSAYDLRAFTGDRLRYVETVLTEEYAPDTGTGEVEPAEPVETEQAWTDFYGVGTETAAVLEENGCIPEHTTIDGVRDVLEDVYDDRVVSMVCGKLERYNEAFVNENG